MTFTAHVRVVRLVAVIVRPTSRYAVMKAMGLITVLLMVSHAVEETLVTCQLIAPLTQASVTTLRVSSVWRPLLSVCRVAAIPAIAATGYECQDGMCIPGPDATGELDV